MLAQYQKNVDKRVKQLIKEEQEKELRPNTAPDKLSSTRGTQAALWHMNAVTEHGREKEEWRKRWKTERQNSAASKDAAKKLVITPPVEVARTNAIIQTFGKCCKVSQTQKLKQKNQWKL